MEWIDEADGVFRGGASAGAIIACYLAVGRDADDIAALMTRTRFGDFQDFPRPGKVIGGRTESSVEAVTRSRDCERPPASGKVIRPCGALRRREEL